MINPFREVNWRPGPAEKRKFAWSLVIGFPCLALVFLCLRRVVTGSWSIEPALVLGGVGLAVGVLLLLLPVLARPPYVVWYFLACCIGIVISNLLVAGLYYLILTPTGLCLRVLGKVPLRKAPDARITSYWQDAELTADPKRYFSQS